MFLMANSCSIEENEELSALQGLLMIFNYSLRATQWNERGMGLIQVGLHRRYYNPICEPAQVKDYTARMTKILSSLLTAYKRRRSQTKAQRMKRKEKEGS
jgi:hypothetical protein